jgi:hypothetical protein
LDQLIGQPKDQLVVRYGPPIYESRTEDGRRYAQFNLSWVETGGGYVNSVPRTEVVRGTYRDDDGDKHRYKETRTVYDDQYVPPYAIERCCLTTFYFNAANRVTSYAYAGEAASRRNRRLPKLGIRFKVVFSLYHAIYYGCAGTEILPWPSGRNHRCGGSLCSWPERPSSSAAAQPPRLGFGSAWTA